jgi:hypothetical protein
MGAGYAMRAAGNATAEAEQSIWQANCMGSVRRRGRFQANLPTRNSTAVWFDESDGCLFAVMAGESNQ